jgi:hypothetical protein
VGEDLLEAQAIEEPLAVSDADIEADAPRPLPEKRTAGSEVDVWRGEVRTVAIAAAGGIVAGAATVAAVRAISRPEKQSRKGIIRRGRKSQNVVASRSFLVDVHVLGR